MTNKQKWKIIKRSIREVNCLQGWLMSGYFIVKICDLLTEIISIFVTSLVVDAVANGDDVGTVLSYAIFVVGCYLILWVTKYLVYDKNNTRVFEFEKKAQKKLWEKVLDMDYVHLEDTGTQNDYGRAKNQIRNDRTGLSSVCNNMTNLISGIFCVSIGAVLILSMTFRKSVKSGGFLGFICSPWGFIAAVVLVILFEIARAFFTNKSIKYFENIDNDESVISANRAMTYYEDFVFGNYRNGKDIRIYSEQELIFDDYNKNACLINKAWLKGYKNKLRNDVPCVILNILSKITVFGFAALRAMSGMISVGEVIAFVLYFTKISEGVTEASNAYGMLMLSPPFCKQYFDFLDIADQKYKGKIPTEKRDDNEYEFEFKHVYFKYPGSDKYVLRDINLKWRIGEKMALVGRNGSGKSTLVKLLCRLYDPSEGEITLNGIDIRKYSYDEYMALFSVVFQDSGLLSFSLGENVAASFDVDKERAEECIRKSGLSDLLDSIPNKLDTFLYKDFDENGVEISGGEAQKICLARAIYKGAPFVVLDEPTAALDPISENEIYTKFSTIVGTRTAIYISHRLSSCKFCDDITVLDNGQIVQRDTHENLLNTEGVYSAMWAAQAEYYKDTAGSLFE